MANEIVATSEENKVTQDLLLDYLKTMNKGLNEQQTKQFLAVAGTFGLNPWKREVYAVTYKNKDGSTDMSIVTGYETYIKRAELNPNYDGFEIEFKGDFKRGKVTKSGKNGSWQVDALVPDGTVSCVCTVYRKDRTHPTREEVFFDEYDQGNSMWQSKPRTMLKKVAIVSAFRKAFPFDFGGMPYTNDELPDHMTGADKLEQQGLTEVPQDAQPQAPAKPKDAKKEIDEETKKFMEGMKGLWTQSPEIYQNTMKELGFKSANNVPPERRGEVFNTIVANISKAQQHQSAPTAMEQQDNGVVDNSLF
ncbi:phage recombination protein Bet [Fibrobacter succinogenes]|uniref:phage recombination protein Bet n=1 Tax=Fibrobacter succinogenes TaxID=833 RepID=UPI001569F262|nr:phage recombination protein Bet [Fibrobacter succinogenes]